MDQVIVHSARKQYRKSSAVTELIDYDCRRCIASQISLSRCHRKSRDFDPIFKVSLANRSATTVTAPLAFWT